MAPFEKRAWYKLGISSLFFLTLILLLVIRGLPLAYLAFLWAGLYALPAVSMRDKKDFDERDSLIARRSKRIALGAVWMLLVAGSMAVWGIYQEGTVTVKADALPMMVAGGTFFITFAESLAALVLYRKQTCGGTE